MESSVDGPLVLRHEAPYLGYHARNCSPLDTYKAYKASEMLGIAAYPSP